MKNPRSTITGVALAIISALLAVNAVSLEEAEILRDVIPTVVTGIAAIINIFFGSDGNNPSGP